MPKRSSKKPRQSDPNQLAVDVVRLATEDADDSAPPPAPKKNAAAVALGRLGGKQGGRARAEKLSKEQRAEIAKKAAAARWERKRRDAGEP